MRLFGKVDYAITHADRSFAGFLPPFDNGLAVTNEDWANWVEAEAGVVTNLGWRPRQRFSRRLANSKALYGK